jgi:hypothetical protein
MLKLFLAKNDALKLETQNAGYKFAAWPKTLVGR